MSNTVLVGAQWGDEGKGKIVDVLTRDVRWVVRFQGGSNAGHTVETPQGKFVLHLVPSGILRPGKRCVIGNGVVVDPLALVREIRELERAGISTKGRLFLSDRAHLVLPFHRALDAAREANSAAGRKIGTTLRGIGPAYEAKMCRTGLRAHVLVGEGLAEAVTAASEASHLLLRGLGAEAIDPKTVLRDLRRAARELRPYIVDTVTLLQKASEKGEPMLLEGAQGALLDIDFGTYPFVTSSSTTAGGACTGTGLPPRAMHRVLGVLKAYTTRVGEGPFPTELLDATGDRLREVGGEFGATTGRPRRCGWFDSVIARTSARLSGIDSWALTKLDVLDGFEELRLAVAYRLDGRLVDCLPADIRALSRCTPVYETLPGWKAQTRKVRRTADLPAEARAYIRRIEELTGVPTEILSVGPARASTFLYRAGGRRPAPR
ncbi:MAG: adenylosuccinate synthase [Kiritimatiellia bacterium]|nr:adenylosuccinate synthase [Kiritimatiellia bacterium]